VGQRDGLDALGAQKSLLALPAIKPLLLGHPAHQLVAILGEEIP